MGSPTSASSNSVTIHGFPTSIGICPCSHEEHAVWAPDCRHRECHEGAAAWHRQSHDPSPRFLCDTWDEAERKWHIRTVQIAHYLGGLGLTPQCASGIAAFYHSTARFVGWIAQMDVPERWLGSAETRSAGHLDGIQSGRAQTHTQNAPSGVQLRRGRAGSPCQCG